MEVRAFSVNSLQLLLIHCILLLIDYMGRLIQCISLLTNCMILLLIVILALFCHYLLLICQVVLLGSITRLLLARKRKRTHFEICLGKDSLVQDVSTPGNANVNSIHEFRSTTFGKQGNNLFAKKEAHSILKRFHGDRIRCAMRDVS